MAIIGLLLLVFVISFIQAKSVTEPDNESITISLLREEELNLNVTADDKKALRYGFHKTQDCKEFQKAFLCIRKCVDFGYQIAHANRRCICTCYKNKVLAKYRVSYGPTKWKYGVPTTSMPPWAKKHEKLQLSEIKPIGSKEISPEVSAGAGSDEGHASDTAASHEAGGHDDEDDGSGEEPRTESYEQEIVSTTAAQE